MVDLFSFRKAFLKLVSGSLLGVQISLALMPAFARAADETTQPPDSNIETKILTPQEEQERQKLLAFLEMKPHILTEVIKSIKDKPYAEEILLKMADYRPLSIIMSDYELEDEPYFERLMAQVIQKQAFEAFLKQDANIIFNQFQALRKLPQAEEILERATRAWPQGAMMSFLNFEGTPYAEKILRLSATLAPWYFLRQSEEFRSLPQAKDIFKEAALAGPAYYYICLEDMKKHSILSEAKILAMEPMIHKALIEKLDQNDRLNALGLVRHFNELHDQRDEVRFKLANGIGARGLYSLITNGREEIYTSSFLGIMNRLIPQLQAEGKTFLDLAKDPLTQGLLPVFVEAAASYGRIDDVFKNLPSEADRVAFVQLTFSSVEKGFAGIESGTSLNKGNWHSSLRMASALADAMRTLPKGQALSVFERELTQAYDRAPSAPVKTALGLVCSLYLADGREPINKDLFSQTDFVALYPVSVQDQVPEKDLFVNGVSHQRVIFYPGEDGKASYDHYLSVFCSPQKQKEGWTKEDHKTFIVIKSPSPAEGGRQIMMVANKPDFLQDGAKDIDAYMEGTPMEVIWHRSHSTFADMTMPLIGGLPDKGGTPNDHLAVMFWGSCGGYNNIAETLARAPKANIISTKSTGTMYVNDVLWDTLCKEALQHGKIMWDSLWEKLSHRLGDKRFEGYTNPTKNVATSLINAFNQLNGREDEAPHTPRMEAAVSPGQTPQLP